MWRIPVLAAAEFRLEYFWPDFPAKELLSQSSDDMMNKKSFSINRRTLAEEVAAKLQEQLQRGRYKVNEKLPIEPELMKSFGVGRSTVREAIKLLSNAGLLRVQQGLGTFVEQSESSEPMNMRLKRAGFDDLDEVRKLLEMKIAEKAALNKTQKDLREIGKYLQARKAAADEGLTEECIEADIQFHIAIAVASKNEILADLYRSASVHLKKWFIQMYPDTQNFLETHRLHQELLDHITSGNAKKAWSTAEKIISHRVNGQ